MNLKSDGENPLNNDEFRRTIDLNVRASATGGEVVNTLSSPGAKLKPQTPCNAWMFESRFLPSQTLSRRERAEATGATSVTTVTSITSATAAVMTMTTMRSIRKVMMMTMSPGGHASGGNSRRGGPPANAHSLSSLSCEEQPSVMTDTHVPFTSEDDMLLKKLKKDSKSWDEIIKCFPGRFKATLQVQ
ncbi:uncharacterized protein BDCG_01280 [Blastomyces dermatitidis ER-3]|uniref:Myb-like domain-containing protein n=1 Tax=Ajellomyces dermatitidis (strain ER-3 / ATCC MYA-2586) TaxID=559297 RepID=A0ABP2ESG0_AJEDR|nr:uncharacterized protein BDCG_01280 [Blastomyces dermatitidis ER-3]EEQ84475.2 hypothetical protein BDCG_01280 [Blastomyces dermatitidis ER-3]